MEMQHLQHFLVTARLGSVGKAAAELNLSQSGVSRSIRTLEDLLGLPLFKRVAKGVRLTEYGEKFLPRAQGIWNARARAINEMLSYNSLKTGRVEVGLHSVFEHTVAAEALARFTQEHRTVDVNVVPGSEPEISTRILDEELDFAFALFVPEHRDSRLVYEKLFSMRCGTYARVGHPLGDAGQVGVAQLAEAEWVLSGSSSLRSTFMEFFADHGVVPPMRQFQCGSLPLALSIVEKSDCLTILPDAVANSPTFAGRVVRLAVEHSPASSPDGGLIYRPDLVQTPAVSALISLFRRLARETLAEYNEYNAA